MYDVLYDDYDLMMMMRMIMMELIDDSMLMFIKIKRYKIQNM